jgi:signal transduction histidine kinase
MYKDAGEWIHLSKDGVRLEVEVYMLAFDFLNKPAILSVIRDVSEQKRTEAERAEHEKLRGRMEQEAELHSVRTRFVSMVSHEFRRPLTTITSSVDLLEHYRDRMTAEAAQKHFVRINEQLREMQNLLDDFLTLMRTEAAQQFNPAQMDLTELCTKLVEEVRLSSTATHTIRYTTDCEKLMLSGDEKLLRHAIGNLLSNAVKYSPEGGEVVLDLRQRDGIEIRVSDQGIGIPEKDQEKLFDPFYRASNVGEMAGTGLGLPIAKQAVELHGGRLEIARSDADGAEFLIWLPVDERTILTGC